LLVDLDQEDHHQDHPSWRKIEDSPPLDIYDFLDLFVQEEYYSYCDEFLVFWQSSWVHLNLGTTSELGNHHHLQETNAGLNEKKKTHPDER